MRSRLVLLVGLLAIGGVACATTSPGVTATRSRQGSSGNLIPGTPDTTTPGTGTPGTGTPGTDSTGSTATSSPNTTTGGTATPTSYDIIDGVVDFGANKKSQPYDGFLTHAFKDIEGFWAEEYKATYGTEWKPLSGGIYAAYPDRTEPIPGCGNAQTAYDDVKGNAFYCGQGDFMVYDDATLLPQLVDELGKEAVAIVLAHEFGHAVQARAGNSKQPVILSEQQADCFAGAWAAHVASGASDNIKFGDRAVRAGLIAMIQVRDPVQLAGQNDPNAHGTGFDRVGAFQDGFKGGPKRCKTFYTENRKLINIPYAQQDPNNGNLPLVDSNPDPKLGPQDIETLLPASLDFFWKQLTKSNSVPFTTPKFATYPSAGPYPTCDGVDASAWKNNAVFCKADNTIYYDVDYAGQQASRIGDMSVGYLYSTAYSDAIQNALHSKRTGEQRALMNDCLTGAWARFISPPIPKDRTDKLELSAGDLDEAIVTAIVRADPTTDTNKVGSAFEKIDAFRAGVLGDVNTCNAQYK
jgi:predicted metalloprotease